MSLLLLLCLVAVIMSLLLLLCLVAAALCRILFVALALVLGLVLALVLGLVLVLFTVLVLAVGAVLVLDFVIHQVVQGDDAADERREVNDHVEVVGLGEHGAHKGIDVHVR